MRVSYEVASRVLELAQTMGEGLRFALEMAKKEDIYWAVNTVCDVGEALIAIERALEKTEIRERHGLWWEWSDWLWEVLDRGARACVEGDWDEALEVLEGHLIPCFEAWKEETAVLLSPCVLC